MLSPRKKRAAIILLAAIAVIVAARFLLIRYSPGAYLRGQLVATRDVRNGRYIELTYGLRAPWFDRGKELLHQRHPEAELRPVAGCVVTDELVDYVTGYNGYSTKAITRHYGRDVFDEAFKDAEAEYLKAHPGVIDSPAMN